MVCGLDHSGYQPFIYTVYNKTMVSRWSNVGEEGAVLLLND